MRLRPRIPLDVLSGFLGSGKTTLLRRHLALLGPAPGIAVVINEFGATSIDHRLVRHSDDAPRVLAAGCACCTVADRLRETLLDLLRDDAGKRTTPVQRIILETSGLADPSSILNTIRTDLVLAEYLDVGRCVVAFDALDGIACAQRYPEVRHQLAAADTVVITKADVAEADGAAASRTFARAINPLARIETAASADFAISALFAGPVTAHAPASDAPRHAGNIRSFSLSLDGAVDWASFSVWLTCLLNRHGARVLRFKAVLDTGTADWPLVVHGVRHLVYPPQHLPEPSSARGRSDLVFIVDGLDPRRIEASLRGFLRFAAAHSELGLRAPASRDASPAPRDAAMAIRVRMA